MITALEFMFAPFVVCLLLIGINIYFGIHVIKREIIFIDISLAQIAAFGATVAVVVGLAPHDHEAPTLAGYLFSIGFTTLAAFLFTILKSQKLPIPLESLIGIAYAVATTGAVILLDKSAGSDVHVHDMMAGSILWVRWSQILELTIVFGLIGLFHYLFRAKFISLTDNYNNGPDNSYSMLWDFLFYTTFGVAVVHSVRVGGILTVFAFLIIPASISALFSKNWLPRILIGWGLGTLVTVFGLFLSWKMDVPSSPTVILFLGIFLLLAVLAKWTGLLKTSIQQKM